MKSDIHPTYNYNVTVTCACGNSFVVGSTQDEIRVEICSACHPFFTGVQKLVDTAGRVDKFKARVETAKKLKAETKKKAAGKQSSGEAEESEQSSESIKIEDLKKQNPSPSAPTYAKATAGKQTTGDAGAK